MGYAEEGAALADLAYAMAEEITSRGLEFVEEPQRSLVAASDEVLYFEDVALQPGAPFAKCGLKPARTEELFAKWIDVGWHVGNCCGATARTSLAENEGLALPPEPSEHHALRLFNDPNPQISQKSVF